MRNGRFKRIRPFSTGQFKINCAHCTRIAEVRLVPKPHWKSKSNGPRGKSPEEATSLNAKIKFFARGWVEHRIDGWRCPVCAKEKRSLPGPKEKVGNVSKM